MKSSKFLWFTVVAASMTCVLGFSSKAHAVSIDFEDLSLDPDSYWKGPDLDAEITQKSIYGEIHDVQIGKFTSKGADFANCYDLSWQSWAGFAYSNRTYNPADYMPGDCYPGDGSNGNPHPVPTGWSSEAYAVPGHDAGTSPNSANYAMGYVTPDFKPTTNFSAPTRLDGMYITNNNYAYYILKEGDPNHWARQFHSGDYLKLIVSGKDLNGDAIGTVNYYLADFRDAASRTDNPRKDNYISDQWTWVDLSSLGGNVKSLEFRMYSTDSGAFGINTPTYFAMDNLTTVGAVVNNINWNAGGDGHSLADPANWSGQTPVDGKNWRLTNTTCQSLTNNLPTNTVCNSITITAGCFIIQGSNAVKLAGDISSLSIEPETISIPLVLEGGSHILHSLVGYLTIGGSISEDGGPFGIIKTGPGKVILAANNSYHGPTRVEVGTLALANNGDISLDSAISVAAGATLEIEAGSHTVGTIDGWGTTVVDPGATLSATSITQDSLVIGTTLMAAVPEPGTFLLLTIAVAGIFIARRKSFRY